MWVLFRALFEHRFWPFAFLLRLLKADFRVLRLLNRFWEGLLKNFAFVEPFLKQRGALHHRDSTCPVLDECFYLLDDCWIGPFCVEWMLDEPNFYADFENSRWMSVGWALDTRWMEAFLPAEMSPLPIAENLTISQGFWKNFFFVYRGAHTESYAERVPHIKIVALVTVWCDWLVGNKSAPHLSTWQLRQQKTTVLTMG